MDALVTLEVVLAIVVLAVIVVVGWRGQRQAKLQQRMGPEYEREVATDTSGRHAVQHRSDAADRRDRLDIR